MRIASWNINGIRARLPLLLEWLAESRPDCVALQETKSTEESFPQDAIAALGYNVTVVGQKGFNGVALLSRRPAELCATRLPGDEADRQARWVEACVPGEKNVARIGCLYLPNGNPAPGPKYDYKLAWMARCESRARALLALEEPTALVGDWNVIPHEADAAHPENWRDDALFLPETRAQFRRILHQGWSDAAELFGLPDGSFTFWDFQRGAWRRNDGVRIDHVLLSPQAADRLVRVDIERDMRGRDKPSDHVPIWCELRL